MMEKDYRLVFVGNTQIGLIGLKEIFDELKTRKDEPESVLKARLVEQAAKKNYIPDSIKEDYRKALFREFKKFLGEKIEEERGECFEIIILGTGCFSCNHWRKIFLQSFPKQESRQASITSPILTGWPNMAFSPHPLSSLMEK